MLLFVARETHRVVDEEKVLDPDSVDLNPGPAVD